MRLPLPIAKHWLSSNLISLFNTELISLTMVTPKQSIGYKHWLEARPLPSTCSGGCTAVRHANATRSATLAAEQGERPVAMRVGWANAMQRVRGESLGRFLVGVWPTL